MYELDVPSHGTVPLFPTSRPSYPTNDVPRMPIPLIPSPQSLIPTLPPTVSFVNLIEEVLPYYDMAQATYPAHSYLSYATFHGHEIGAIYIRQ